MSSRILHIVMVSHAGESVAWQIAEYASSRMRHPGRNIEGMQMSSLTCRESSNCAHKGAVV